MATSEAKEIKKQETLVRFSIISYQTSLRVISFTIIYRDKEQGVFFKVKWTKLNGSEG